MSKIESAELREHLFAGMVVEPVICPFIPARYTFVIMKGNYQVQSKGGVRTPDFWVSVCANDLSMTIFMAEVKTPTYMDTCKEEEPGFIKLVNQMKDELNFVAKSGVKSRIPVFGLLVQGYKCKLYRLDLDYYKLNRLALVSQFYLPTDRYAIDRLRVDIMSILEENLDFSIDEKLKDFFGDNDTGNDEDLPLESFCSPHRA